MVRKTKTLTIRLTDDHQRMLEQIKEDRGYDSVSETIRELIRLASKPRLGLPANYVDDLQLIAKFHDLDSPSEAMRYLIRRQMRFTPRDDNDLRREFYSREFGRQVYVLGMTQLAEQGSERAQKSLEQVEAERVTRQAKAQQFVTDHPDRWQILLDESKELYPDEWQWILEGWSGESLDEENHG